MQWVSIDCSMLQHCINKIVRKSSSYAPICPKLRLMTIDSMIAHNLGQISGCSPEGYPSVSDRADRFSP